MPRNTLLDLNNHLFSAMERLDDDDLEGEKLNAEVERSRAIAGLAQQVVAVGNLTLKALVAQDSAVGNRLKLPKTLTSGEEV